jgi:hypothetical protein
MFPRDQPKALTQVRQLARLEQFISAGSTGKFH